MNEPMTFLDFFSGVGGFRKGFELCGMVCKGHCEIDEFADRSYRAIHDIQEDEWYAVSIKRDIEQAKVDKTAPSAPEQEKPDKAADDRLLDDLLGAPVQKEEHASPNPAAAKTEKSRPSAPISKKQSRTAEGTVKPPEERPSVREELREIRESRQKEAAEPGVSEPTPAKEPKKQPTTTHKQPSRKKPKKAKER